MRLTLHLDGGEARIDTGLGYFDHMLMQLAKHGGFGLEVEAKGDLPVDSHHLVEDVGLCLGDASRKPWATAPASPASPMPTCRWTRPWPGWSWISPGRPWCEFHADLPPIILGDGFQVEMVREFFVALAMRGGLAIHADLLRGVNNHHKVEALFKALARALRQATRIEGGGIPSTKGTLSA